MDFTREPILESVITPKEGCKLVVRSSKGACQEEFFVDSVEVVSFGSTFFLRSLERPKSFLVPASDYEILEVREARMVLKTVGFDRSIKIKGGREGGKRKTEEKPEEEAEVKAEPKLEKRRERRRHYRKRRGGEESSEQEEAADTGKVTEEGGAEQADSAEFSLEGEVKEEGKQRTPRAFRPLLPPPSMLISESIEKYKGSHLFKGVFYTREEEEAKLEEGQEETEKEMSFLPESPLEQSEDEGNADIWDENADELEEEDEESEDIAREGENPVGQNW